MAAPALLALAILAWWVRSYWMMDSFDHSDVYAVEVARRDEAAGHTIFVFVCTGVQRRLASCRGCVGYTWRRVVFEDTSSEQAGDFVLQWAQHRGRGVQFITWNAANWYGTNACPAFPWRTLGFWFYTERNAPGSALSRFDVIVPYWALLLAPAAWWARRLRREPYRPGLCARCGYDLRASTGRCPECGELIPAATNMSASTTPMRSSVSPSSNCLPSPGQSKGTGE